jgi:hypothetical protein
MKLSALRWILIVPDPRRIHITADSAGVVQESYRRGKKNLEHFLQAGKCLSQGTSDDLAHGVIASAANQSHNRDSKCLEILRLKTRKSGG